MRVEAVDVSPGILNPLIGLQIWEQSSDLMAMSANGRSFPIEEMLKARGSQPSQVIQGGSRVINLDLREITKLLQLSRNKRRVLRLLKRGDLIKILYLLPKELLVNALRLFSKSKLLRLIMMLPKPMLLKILLRIFKVEDLIKKMPTSELMRILRSHRLNNRELVKGLQKMDPQFLKLLLMRIYGNYDFSHLKQYDIMRIFMHTNKERLMEAFKTLPFKALVPFVTDFVKRDPELLMAMSDQFIFKLLSRMPKPTLLQGCMALPNEMLIKFLSQLPTPMLVLAAAQIDDHSLEQYLVSQQPNLLKMLAGAA